MAARSPVVRDHTLGTCTRVVAHARYFARACEMVPIKQGTGLERPNSLGRLFGEGHALADIVLRVWLWRLRVRVRVIERVRL